MVRSMGHAWRIVKNSQVGGHRPRTEYLADVQNALAAFVENEANGFALHESVGEALGLASGEQVIDLDGLFVDPYPFLHSHGSYVCGLLATPTSVADGLPEFTSLYVLATPTQFLSVILDPPATYAGPFGQRLLNRHAAHLEDGRDDVGGTLLMVIRDNVTSLNFALRELSHDVDFYEETLRTFGRNYQSNSSDVLSIIEAYLVKLRVEIGSLKTVVQQTSAILEAIAGHRMELAESSGVFDRRHEITADNLAMQAARTVAIRDRLDHEVGALLEKCEQLRDKFFVEATHRIGAVAALLLVPSFIVGVYGQNFDFPERHWMAGYGFSWVLILTSLAFLLVYFRRKRWI